MITALLPYLFLLNKYTKRGWNVVYVELKVTGQAAPCHAIRLSVRGSGTEPKHFWDWGREGRRAAGPRENTAIRVSYFLSWTGSLSRSAQLLRWLSRIFNVQLVTNLPLVVRKKEGKKTGRQNVRGGRHSPVDFEAPGAGGCLRPSQQFLGNRRF